MPDFHQAVSGGFIHAGVMNKHFPNSFYFFFALRPTNQEKQLFPIV